MLKILNFDKNYLQMSKYWFKNKGVEFLLLLTWIFLNFYFFITTLISYNHKKYFYTKIILGNSLAVARASAYCLNFNCMLILLPVCRNTLELIRGFLTKLKLRAFHKATDEAIHFHKLVAYTIVGLTLIHYYAHCFNLERFNDAYNSRHFKNVRQENITTAKNLKLSSFMQVGNNDEYSSYLAYSLTYHFSRSKTENYLNPISYNQLNIFNIYSIVAGWSGVIITTALLIMFASSVEHIRRHYFEVFWFTHQLFVVFFGFLIIHGSEGSVRQIQNLDQHDPEICSKLIDARHNEIVWTSDCPEPKFIGQRQDFMNSWKWVTGPLCLYIIEVLIRFYNGFIDVEVLKVTEHQSGVMQLDMRKEKFLSRILNKPADQKKYVRGQVGQYIKIMCKEVSKTEWHPFTLTSSPEQDILSCYIRIAGDWTGDLSKYLKECGDTDRQPVLAIDGPFGACSQDMYEFKEAVCIGMGIGITPFASLVNSLKFRLNLSQTGPILGDRDLLADMRLRKITFIWSTRTTKELEWFLELLNQFENLLIQRNQKLNPKIQKDHSFDFELQLYITANMSPSDISHIILNEDNPVDPVSNLKHKTRYKRPHWDKIFEKIKNNNVLRVTPGLKTMLKTLFFRLETTGGGTGGDY